MQQVVKGVDEQRQQGSKEHLQWPWSTDHNDFWYVESCRDLTHWYWSFTPCLATLVTCHCTLWNADLVGIVKSVHCFSSSADNSVLFQSAYRHPTDDYFVVCPPVSQMIQYNTDDSVYGYCYCYQLHLIAAAFWPSVLWRCRLGGRKGIWPVKNWVVGCWRGYLSGARCRLAYGPADVTVSCFSKIQIGFAFLVPTHPGSPRKGAVKRVCVCVCVQLCCFTFSLASHFAVQVLKFQTSNIAGIGWKKCPQFV